MEGIDQQVVGDKKTAVRAPRVRAESALSAHSREVLTIEHREQQAKVLVGLSLPLLEYRGRRATTIVFALFRSSSPRAMSPASIVLPSPVSSAMKRCTRGRRTALIPARTGDGGG